jgi:class 3 adenylate cyclase
MKVDIDLIYKTTLEHYRKAKQNQIEKRAFFEHADTAISDVIPGFDADKLEFGSYDKENFAVLFVDMRDSTKRAQDVGAEKTFLTMHVFLTALLEVVKCYKGKVIDIMGDGLMVFWGGEEAREEDNMIKRFAVKNAGLCGRDMLLIREKVINKIIKDEDLGRPINIGVGVTFDSVIVTKIGIPGSYDVKAFGDCINTASKYADKTVNKVKVSKKVRNEWPKSKGGKIRFTSVNGEDAFYLESVK